MMDCGVVGTGEARAKGAPVAIIDDVIEALACRLKFPLGIGAGLMGYKISLAIELVPGNHTLTFRVGCVLDVVISIAVTHVPSSFQQLIVLPMFRLFFCARSG
jgi:hypothetical protein